MSIWIEGIELIASGSLLRVLRVAPECNDRIGDAGALAGVLKAHDSNGDVLVFGQRVPDATPRHGYHIEYESLAAMRLTTYEHWLREQISKDTRKNIQRAAKRGIVVRECAYDDTLVAGIKRIYDESPVRQGKRFSHYGKDFDTVKRENGTYSEHSVVLGAFVEEELVGFVKFFVSGRCASTLQVISKAAHRDKKTNNALLAKAVKVCTQRGVEYLQYGVWSTGTLGDFKMSNGFTKFDMPCYSIPLTWRGRAALRFNLQHGWRSILPSAWIEPLKQARRQWHERSA